MKFHIFNLLKTILSLAILITGCSIGNSDTSTAATAIPNTPATPTVSSALLPLTGEIAYIYSTSDTGYNYHVYVVSAGGSGVKDVTPPNLPLIHSLALSLDGENIAFEAPVKGKAQIFTMKADGSDIKQLTFREEGAHAPSWSPDGKYIIFLSIQKDILDYRGVPADQGYIMKSDGSGLRQLKDDHELVVNGLSYRSENLISISVPATTDMVRTYFINLDGAIQKQYPEFTIDGIPVWSPNGELVAFSAIRTDCSGIIVMQADASDQRCLLIDNMTSPLVYVRGVSWSPDGNYIIFSSNLDGDYDLYVVKLDGSGLIQLTDMPGDEGSPVWSQTP